MKVLVVSRYKAKLPKHVVAFVAEQVAALQGDGCEVELFLLQGNYRKQWNTLRAKIRNYQPDIIHAHYGLSCLLANLATRRVQVVSTYHGSDINNPRIRPFSRLAMRLSAWNIFVSRRNMQLVSAVDGRGCTLLPCGIDLPMPWSELQQQPVDNQLTLSQWVTQVLTPGRRHVLFAGAFDNAVKNPELAKAAIADFRWQMADLDLIELKGYTRAQVYALMYTCDALLMTSRTEGSPQVIKEAMACGCPIVSVDVGDVKERTAGVEGCYVVPSREPSEIAAAVEKAIAFKGKTKGRERILADGLTNEQVAKRIIRIYEKIIDLKFRI